MEIIVQAMDSHEPMETKRLPIDMVVKTSWTTLLLSTATVPFITSIHLQHKGYVVYTDYNINSITGRRLMEYRNTLDFGTERRGTLYLWK